MRLRYVRLQQDAPLSDVEMRFRQESVLGRAYAIHFIVGVNGSGKSRLLRALTEAFLELHKRSLPKFPITLAFELGSPSAGTENPHRLCYLHHPNKGESEAQIRVYDLAKLAAALDAAQETIDELDWGSFGSGPTPYGDALQQEGTFADLGSGDLNLFLPSSLVVYTSGAVEPWRFLFESSASPAEVVDAEFDAEQERPVFWTKELEIEYQDELLGLASSDISLADISSTHVPSNLLASDENLRTQTWANFITETELGLALWAILLTIDESELDVGGSPKEFGRALNYVGWQRTVTLGLRLNLSEELLSDLLEPDQNLLYRLSRLATFIRRDPEPGVGRLFAFDLLRRLELAADDTINQGVSKTFNEGSTQDGLEWAFNTELPTSLTIFQTLYRWQKAGILAGVTTAFEKTDSDNLLTLNDLSDGEKMYLGRMSVLHLTRDDNDVLVILDEPETHFNDVWKREVVDVIDDALRDKSNEVVISTHSSIALTDAFNEEINVLRKFDGETGSAEVVMPTFGADPSEVMIKLFDAPDSTGQRAFEYLEKQLDRNWTADQQDELERLIELTGSGYHRSELRSIWIRLTDALPNSIT